MMKLSIPHNWQDDLISSINFVCADEFYGRIDPDIIGGGIPSNICQRTTRKNFADEIKRIHKSGRKFNYVFSGLCMDNQELSNSMQKELRKKLDLLAELSVDSITVSIPYLLGFIKRNYPSFKTCVSVNAQVDSVDKARFWEDSGVDKITLFETTVNKNLGLIKKIRQGIKCQIQLIANNGCLCDCPFVLNHALLGSHASQKNHISKGFVLDFYRIMCTYMKIKDPANFIIADWIRPEDLHYYEDVGVDYIKIVNRGMTTKALIHIVNAYANRNYKGNLLDLLPGPSKNINYNKNPLVMAKLFFYPFRVNIFKLFKLKEITSELDANIYIDNKKLDGFLISLQDKNCGARLCNECGWCKAMAEKIVKIDVGKFSLKLAMMQEFIDDFIQGKLFRYF